MCRQMHIRLHYIHNICFSLCFFFPYYSYSNLVMYTGLCVIKMNIIVFPKLFLYTYFHPFRKGKTQVLECYVLDSAWLLCYFFIPSFFSLKLCFLFFFSLIHLHSIFPWLAECIEFSLVSGLVEVETIFLSFFLNKPKSLK